MARRKTPPRAKSRAKTKSSTPRSPSLKLNKDFWLGTALDIKKWSLLNLPEDKLCPILGVTPTGWVCDHDHYDLRVRGMISQQANKWEGYVQKYWMKYCQKYSDKSLPDALRSLAEYLEKPYWLENPLHFKGVHDLQRHLKRCKKETIVQKALTDFGLILDVENPQAELIKEYVEVFIKHFEEDKVL